MNLGTKTTLSVLCLGSLISARAFGDDVLYNNSPGSYAQVTASLANEFGTTAFPPIVETLQSSYVVQGNGAVNLTFNFRADTGSFLFNFGYYRITDALNAINLSTNAGKVAYATQALAVGNATVVFDDVTDNPGATRITTATGGDTLGFFLIPDNSLALFQSNPGLFGVNGLGSRGDSPPYRFPLFGLANANPGNADQLLSSAATPFGRVVRLTYLPGKT